MSVAPHLVRLYNKTSRRYRKLLSKLQRDGASSWQRQSFLSELRRLLKRLRHLHARLKIAAATGAVVMMLNTTPANAQAPSPTLGPFVMQNRLNNPLREPIFSGEGIITTVDLDEDGDEDVVLGTYHNYGGRLRYFENKSSEGQPVYIELEGVDNPVDGILAETTRVAPAFADIDEDGDLDLFLGQNGAYTEYTYPYTNTRGIEYYRNDAGTFTKQTGAWNSGTGAGNPFDGMKFGHEVTPVFVDMDHDDDYDVVIGSYLEPTYPYYDAKYITYYQNDGSGNFTPVDINLDSAPSNFNYEPVYPALADMDGDGDFDMIIGSYYDGYIRYYRQDAPLEFSEAQAAWDPVAKTGNPFFEYETGLNASVAVLDFNNDGLIDLFVADQMGYYSAKYSDNIVDYYANTGNAVFVKKEEFENPFGGVFVKQAAAPAVIDIDADGDLDALIGNKYSYTYYDYNTMQYVSNYSYITHYRNTDGVLKKVSGESNPVDTLEVYGHFVPQFEDIDGDNDLDLISGNYYGEVTFFRNDNGVYRLETTTSPFAGIAYPWGGAARLADIDNDGDLDLFLANYGNMYFFENTGTAQAPQFTEVTGTDSPLYSARFFTYGTPYQQLVDLDHDGDLDLIFNGSNPDNVEDAAIVFMENTGTPENPVFETAEITVFKEMNDRARTAFVDYDGDGDLDAFAGADEGIVNYLQNQNPVVNTSGTTTTFVYDPAKDGAVVLIPDLTLTDNDNDLIVQATVTIQNYQSGETLSFTAQAGITGAFDTETGVLTLRGKATLAEYQAVLRTVTFELTDGGGGRKRPVKRSTTPKTISFAVFDIDFTNPQILSRTIDIFLNTPPVIETEPVSTPAGSVWTINLLGITTDIDDNLDPTSFVVVQQPVSGANASIEVVSGTVVNLNLDYEGITFHGTDQLTIRACDESGECTESILTVQVDVDAVIQVYNAVAPNSLFENRILRIGGPLPQNNKVTIFNRWGDKVYEVRNYDNSEAGNAFKGLNDNGNALPSGTYFYTIEAPSLKKVTGYLVLKQ